MYNCYKLDIDISKIKSVNFLSEVDNNSIEFLNNHTKVGQLYSILELNELNTDTSIKILEKEFPKLQIKYLDSEHNEIMTLIFNHFNFSGLLEELNTNRKNNININNYTLYLKSNCLYGKCECLQCTHRATCICKDIVFRDK